MQRIYLLAFVLVAWVLACGSATNAYMKSWEPREEGDVSRWEAEKASPYEQAMLKKLQAYLNSDALGHRWPEADTPVKRQMLYNQCYFNPISCFKRRK